MHESTKFKSKGSNEFWPDQISPLQGLNDDVFVKAGLQVFIKRDDLLKPFGGNKWRKLKYNFLQMSRAGIERFVTFGGPFSNHLYASATMAREYQLSATFIVRGSVDDQHNPVLKHARDCGVDLVAVDRKSYGRRYTPEFKAELESAYPSAYVIPEGGGNRHGFRGCTEIVTESVEQLGRRPDAWIVAAGTGNTAAGIADKLCNGEKVIAIAALRASIIQPAYQSSIELLSESARQNISLSDAYHFGGMAKWSEKLLAFIRQFEMSHGIFLDPIYTGKAMRALYDLAGSGAFERGSTVVFVHTGGMPGRMSFNYRYGGLLSDPDL